MAVHAMYGSGISADTKRGPSGSIWGSCPIKPWLPIDPNLGHGHWDDFLSGVDYATNTAVQALSSGPYNCFTGNGPSLAGSVTAATDDLGIQNFVSGTSADVLGVMTLGGGAPFVFSSTAGLSRKLWFECRFKLSAVVDADQVQWFCGMTEEDRAAASGIFASGGGDLGFTTTIDLIGFARFDNDGDSVSFVYQKASQTCQDVLQVAIAADTYVKLGFIYDPNEDTTRRITVFVNGVPQTTYVTGTQMAAATFPLGEEMTITQGIQNDTTTSNTAGVDWWGISQMGP